MRFQHEHVAQARYRSEITHHPGKAHLRPATIINPKAQGMLDGARYYLSRYSLGPVTVRQKFMDDTQSERA